MWAQDNFLATRRLNLSNGNPELHITFSVYVPVLYSVILYEANGSDVFQSYDLHVCFCNVFMLKIGTPQFSPFKENAIAVLRFWIILFYFLSEITAIYS